MSRVVRFLCCVFLCGALTACERSASLEPLGNPAMTQIEKRLWFFSDDPITDCVYMPTESLTEPARDWHLVCTTASGREREGTDVFPTFTSQLQPAEGFICTHSLLTHPGL